MEPLVFALVLLAALLHAGWNALIKGGKDPVSRLVMVHLCAALVLLPLLPFTAVPDPASWPYLLASVVVHQFYYLFLILGYRHGDLSVVYPIARGAAPLLVALGAWVVAGETLSGLSLLAVVLISVAVLGLAGERSRGRRIERSAVYALCTGLSIAVYTVLDGLGGRAAGDVLGYIVWLFLLDGLVLTTLVAGRQGARFWVTLRGQWLWGGIGGLCAATAYGVVIWAMSRAPMAYVSALRETSVILAALLGMWLLREPASWQRAGSAVLVVIGVAALQLGRLG